MKYEEGEPVLIDIEKTQEHRPYLLKEFHGKKIHKGIVVGEINKEQYSVRFPDVNNGKQAVNEKAISRYCEEHMSNPVYHDRKEEWICPFCET